MAFQVGSRIDPRLATADLSGFREGSAAVAQGISSAVSNVAQGMMARGAAKQKVKKAEQFGKSLQDMADRLQEQGIQSPQIEALRNYGIGIGETLKDKEMGLGDKVAFAENMGTMTQSLLQAIQPQKAVEPDFVNYNRFLEQTGIKYNEKSGTWKIPGGEEVGLSGITERYGAALTPGVLQVLRGYGQPMVTDAPQPGTPQSGTSTNGQTYTSGGFSIGQGGGGAGGAMPFGMINPGLF